MPTMAGPYFFCALDPEALGGAVVAAGAVVEDAVGVGAGTDAMNGGVAGVDGMPRSEAGGRVRVSDHWRWALRTLSTLAYQRAMV